MTARQIMRDTLNRTASSECIVPYVVSFDDKELEDAVNRYYGRPWQELTRTFYFAAARCNLGRRSRLTARYDVDIWGTVWRTDRGALHLEVPAMSEPSFKDYKLPTLEQILDPYVKLDMVKLANEEIAANPDLFSKVAIGLGLFEATWFIRGFENALTDIAAEPEFYEEFVGQLTDLYLGVVRYFADVKCDAVFFADDWGGQQGVIMGPDNWRWKQLYDEIHKQGKFTISHCCGSVVDIMPDIIEIGLDMLESVQPEARGMDPFALKAAYGDRLGFWGCIGSQSLIPYGTPEEITEHVRKLKRDMSVNGGYLAAPAKALQAGTPLRNAIALIDALREGDCFEGTH
jgi:uroporphyrinogen decarboxylase